MKRKLEGASEYSPFKRQRIQIDALKLIKALERGDVHSIITNPNATHKDLFITSLYPNVIDLPGFIGFVRHAYLRQGYQYTHCGHDEYIRTPLELYNAFKYCKLVPSASTMMAYKYKWIYAATATIWESISRRCRPLVNTDLFLRYHLPLALLHDVNIDDLVRILDIAKLQIMDAVDLSNLMNHWTIDVVSNINHIQYHGVVPNDAAAYLNEAYANRVAVLNPLLMSFFNDVFVEVTLGKWVSSVICEYVYQKEFWVVSTKADKLLLET